MALTGPYIENYTPAIKQARGLSTLLTVSLGGSANMDLSNSSGTLKLPTGGLTGSGQMYNVISGQGAGPTTLTAGQSDSVILFDRAAGNAFVLPTPQVGLQYTFITTVSVTSNSAEVVTDAGTTFLLGSVAIAPNSATTGGSAFFSGDGSTTVEFTMNGTTQGGLIGSQVTFTCVSSTLWNVSGIVMGSGTLATPFTT